MVIWNNKLAFAIREDKNKPILKIKYIYFLRHIEVQIDRMDNKSLLVIAKDKNNYIDLVIQFNKSDKVNSMKKILEENRKSAKNTEFLLFDSYFDNLIFNAMDNNDNNTPI
mgnify:CR=1 FL=1